MKCRFCGELIADKEFQEQIRFLKDKQTQLSTQLENIRLQLEALETGFCGVYCQGNYEDTTERILEA